MRVYNSPGFRREEEALWSKTQRQPHLPKRDYNNNNTTRQTATVYPQLLPRAVFAPGKAGFRRADPEAPSEVLLIPRRPRGDH